MPDSIQQIVARLEQRAVEGVNNPGIKAHVEVYDLTCLIHSWRLRGRRIRELEGRTPAK